MTWKVLDKDVMISRFDHQQWAVLEWLEENVGAIHYDEEIDQHDMDGDQIGDGWFLASHYACMVVSFAEERHQLACILRWT